MPRLTTANPKYRKHKASGQAVVTINGSDVYLGPHGTKASRAEYDRVIGEWLASGRQRPIAGPADLSIAELVAAYWAHAETYYASGHSGELSSFRLALRPMRRLYGATAVAAFGPIAMKVVREEMVRLGWSRPYVNVQLGRLRRMFKWGTENELVPAGVYQSLATIAGLRAGKTDAPETAPVRPVPQAYVDAVLAVVSPQIGAMIRLQSLCGARPGEIAQMRGCDIDMSGRLWLYKPATHKNAHRGHDRTIYLGRRCQDVLQPFLKPDLQAYLFSPAEADEWHRQQKAARRKTPLSCGNRPGSNRVRRPKREAGERYASPAYARAIARACDVAFPPPPELSPEPGETRTAWRARLTTEQHAAIKTWRDDHRWHPNQLRHNFATFARKEFGLEAAQALLGHRTLQASQIYAEKNVEAAMRIMGEVG